ncbi:hypothetical protein HGRIS_000951 [Hohenbuehelia grisea]|uniref:glucan endo-1,3-beta-D-glucosidase n=1 Tax=Hohenbuehelia grisea TaxID=104357 RepID=A0ABR3IQE4_9AGAR
MLIPLAILIYIIVIAVGSKKAAQTQPTSTTAVVHTGNITSNAATAFTNITQEPWDDEDDGDREGSAGQNPNNNTESPAPQGNSSTSTDSVDSGPSYSGCFPALDFDMPSYVPTTTKNWWCDMSSEYAFMGFSYEVTSCQSFSKLKKEFTDIRNTFNGRYVRIYGACDRKGFYDELIEAAWQAGLGVHALIWFGFDGGDIWKTRRDTVISILRTNPKAKFVVRALQFGSEPLFDYVLKPSDLAAQVKLAQKALANTGIPVTVSEMAYGYQAHKGSDVVLEAVDLIDAHMLPFFSTEASTGRWSLNWSASF